MFKIFKKIKRIIKPKQWFTNLIGDSGIIKTIKWYFSRYGVNK